jgi:hypothetical protein
MLAIPIELQDLERAPAGRNTVGHERQSTGRCFLNAARGCLLPAIRCSLPCRISSREHSAPMVRRSIRICHSPYSSPGGIAGSFGGRRPRLMMTCPTKITCAPTMRGGSRTQAIAAMKLLTTGCRQMRCRGPALLRPVPRLGPLERPSGPEKAPLAPALTNDHEGIR